MHEGHDAIRRNEAALRIDLRWIAACAAALAAAVLLRLTVSTNEDVSWLAEVADRLVGGAKPYVDFLEVNPPASILIYVPASILSRWAPLSLEQATNALLFLGVGLNLWACSAILRKGGSLPAHPERALFASLVILLVLPTYTFAEREHVALIAILPVLATIIVRCAGGRVSGWSIVIAGTGCATAIALKPIFALGLVGPALGLTATRGPIRLVRSGELWLAGGLAAVYGAAVLLVLPDFAERMLPIALAVYVPARVPVWLMLTEPGVVIWACTGIVVVWSGLRQGFAPLVTVPLASSAGFAATYVLQGKGYAYQSYPALALALFSLLPSIDRKPTRAAPPDGMGHAAFKRLLVSAFGFLTVGAAIFLDRHYRPDQWTPGLRDALRIVAPKPKLLAISPILAMGQPFAREIGGTWVGSAPSTWISGDADALIAAGADPARFASWISMEQARFAQDIETRHPDVVLIDGDRWQLWVDNSPPLARAMESYERRGRFGTVALWLRKPERQSAADRSPEPKLP